MKKIIFFLANLTHLVLADGETCSIVADCNANIESRLTALEFNNDELVTKIENLEAKNEKLESKNDALEAKNLQLESELGQLKADVVDLEEMVLPGKTPAKVKIFKILKKIVGIDGNFLANNNIFTI